MARVIIETDDGHRIGEIEVNNKNGPWTDCGDTLDSIAWDIYEALRYEGDEG